MSGMNYAITRLKKQRHSTGNWQMVRHNYYGLLLELFIERWPKPWYEYTENNNLCWTGHYWEHGWPSPHHGGDNMAMYAWHQVPGIDMLFNTQKLRPDQFGNVRAVKELNSVANQLNKKRTLSETYGASGWGLSFEDMKRLGDWEYTLGVNLMNQHLAYMTLKGRRKGDFPPSFSYHAPYWEDYGVLANYYKRLSYALTRGEQINKTLVLEPTTTAWMYYSPVGSEPQFNKTGDDFEQMLDVMEKYQLEYDLGCENIMHHHGKIKNDKFVVGERIYGLIVLPAGLQNVDRSTFELIKKYMANGGKVLSLIAPPQYIDGKASGEFNELIQKHQEGWIKVDKISDATALNYLNSADFKVNEPENIQGKVYHHRRYIKDGQIIFWSNFNKEEISNIAFKVKGNAVSELNAFNGEVEPYPFKTTEGFVEVRFELEPAGSILLFVHDDPEQAVKGSFEKPKDEKVVDAGKTIVKRTSPNVMAIDNVDLEVQGDKQEDILFAVAADDAYKANGLEQYRRYNPWAVAVQYKTNIIDMGKNFGPNSGFTATYPFYVDKDFLPGSLRAVVEWPHLYAVGINGKPVDPENDEWWLDRSFGVFEIGAFIQSGRNEISLTVSPMHIHAEIEPVFLLGDFSLLSQQKGFKIVPPQKIETGPWKNQGMPFYSHGVAYSKTFEAKEKQKYKVKLNDWNGTVARVIVNGKKAGIIGWQPYELDISKWVKKGSNMVVVEVVGSLKNVLGPHHGKIREGIVTPWSFFYGPDHQPPGMHYHLDDYGLFEDFDIVYTAPS